MSEVPTITIRKSDGTQETYQLCVALINTKDQGRPKLISILHDEQIIDIGGGEEFTTLFLPQDMLKPR